MLTRCLRGVCVGVWGLGDERVQAMLGNNDTVMGLFLFEAVLPTMTHMSKALQKSKRYFSQLYPLREHYLQKLDRFVDSPSNYVRYWSAHVLINAAREGYVAQAMTLGDVANYHKDVATPYVRALQKAMREELTNDTVCHFSLYDPESDAVQELPETVDDSTNISKLLEQLNALVGHYTTLYRFPGLQREGGDVTVRDPFFSADRVADLRRELRGMLGEIRARKLKTYDDVMDMIASERDVQLMYPASTDLVHMVATFPVGTATCERCFSKMKLLKTRLRKRLYDSTMESILHLAFSASYSPSSGVREETMRSIFVAWTSSARRLPLAPYNEYLTTLRQVRALRQSVRQTHGVGGGTEKC